jgi:hypothetical protein
MPYCDQKRFEGRPKCSEMSPKIETNLRNTYF